MGAGSQRTRITAPTHPRTHASTYPRTHAPTHPCTHTRTHPRTRASTHPRTHARTLINKFCRSQKRINVTKLVFLSTFLVLLHGNPSRQRRRRRRRRKFLKDFSLIKVDLGDNYVFFAISYYLSLLRTSPRFRQNHKNFRYIMAKTTKRKRKRKEKKKRKKKEKRRNEEWENSKTPARPHTSIAIE